MIHRLLSVPSPLQRFLARGTPASAPPGASREVFVHSDPPGRKLGSGGGTAALLRSGWHSLGRRRSRNLWDWVGTRQCLVLHAGGESRRLPAYAAIGKTFLPVPALGGSAPRRFDQTLSDFQFPAYFQVLQEAGSNASVLVASGDVWLDLNALRIPPVTADITGIGMRVTPELASSFGVYFVARADAAAACRAQPVSFFLQKPSPADIYRHLSRYDFYVDTGLWLLSKAAVRFLFRRCGWNDNQQAFTTRDGHPRYVDLYTELGGALGSRGTLPVGFRRLGWSRLTSNVIPLDDARFFHLGSSRQLFESFEQILRLTGSGTAERAIRSAATLENVAFPSSLPVWLDGVTATHPLKLDGFNVLTGQPARARNLHLRQRQCLELAPIGSSGFAFRPYLVDDTLRGNAGAGGTICGHDAAEWLARRGFSALAGDVFDLPIYPVIRGSEISQDILDWFFAEQPDSRHTPQILRSHRVSASEIPAAINFRRYFGQRRANHADSVLEEFEACLKGGDTRVFAQDFSAIAQLCEKDAPTLRRWLLGHYGVLLAQLSNAVHQSRLLSLIGQLTRGPTRHKFTREAYHRLQAAVVSSVQLFPSRPRLALKEDQIVWGRSPVRLDLAGGWTDTPPYCLEYGGAVINVAVLLNGQPPIQAFVRPLADPVISLRSIDLGSHEIIRTDAALAGFRDPRSNFSLAKAALALAGFHPDFSAGRSYPSLRTRLAAFGGGLEISLLSAVPKGSGLGTSSILGATLLGALNRACNLGWDEVALYNRVLGVEQLLTTGGGWQDQAGALFRGVKLIETTAGAAQTPNVRYLPGHLFDSTHANRTLLLYYTGITRLAKGILKEIVEDMFLGRFETLQTMNLIRANALELFRALQQGETTGLQRCIARSWDLNKRLDSGTTTPEIERLIRLCGADLPAAKLLGAGGGGYMLLCASSTEAGRRIRERLESSAPNRRARFIDFEIAERGLEVTVS